MERGAEAGEPAEVGLDAEPVHGVPDDGGVGPPRQTSGPVLVREDIPRRGEPAEGAPLAVLQPEGPRPQLHVHDQQHEAGIGDVDGEEGAPVDVAAVVATDG